MRVVAIKEGYDNIKLREVGEEFEMPEGAKGKWFVPVGDFKKLKDAKRAEAKKVAEAKTLKAASEEPPMTFSQLVGNADAGDLV